MAVNPPNPTLVLRYADVGVATYASLRVVGQPSATVTWVIEESALRTVGDLLTDALPEPRPPESPREAIERAVARGSLATPAAEKELAAVLGEHLIAPAAWQLIAEHASRSLPTLFVAPTARLATAPWSLLASNATPDGRGPRLIEVADILMAAPPNIANSPRRPPRSDDRGEGPPLLILDPRVPGQLPDSPLGSVLGRPDADGPLARHFAALMERCAVLPGVNTAVALFRNAEADRAWLAEQLDLQPSRLLFVGHATAADGDVGHADRAAVHLAEPRPLTAADMMTARLPIPPRAALLACASGGDYRFDEATGLVAALILGGAVLVTATLWSLPTTAGYRQFCGTAGEFADPMGEVVVAVDTAHQAEHAGRAVNSWQRRQLDRWRAGEVTASPLYWAALTTYAVDGAR
ncbi:CHAT domain-containing protein [Mycolicibacterium pyrenivorans]|uniref:CHAT domain-containing protein n=1 Tax=Mycolicibacterium pyrenivorans TaxID=187102 RepID=UPI0021F2B821|nr:CHAT domain-containing protein [Mycolicibacterium pyrenivorans]MCV7152842.1 CHAT domain-containing protein [Mycolicibacterium pyrenivorans]